MRYQILFKQYVWLVNTIYRYKSITLEEINRLWINTDMSEGEEIPRSTFNRHKEAIEDMFGIYIECDRKNGYKYYIDNAEDLRHDTIQNWMLSTMTVNNLLSEYKSIHHRVLLESIPSSEEFLSSLMEAMRKDLKVKIFYQKYSKEPGKERIISPLCLKLDKRRWYVLARTEQDEMRIFSLDRIQSLEITELRFKYPKNFDAEEYFANYIGIMTHSEYQKQRIVIRAFDKEKFYLRDLPLHSSQVEIVNTDDYSDFEYNLVPTIDFIRQLLARGGLELVIEPKWLADRLKDMFIHSASMYETEPNSIEQNKSEHNIT